MTDETPNVHIRVHKESGQPLSDEELAELRAVLATAEPVTPEQLREFLLDDRHPLVVQGGEKAFREWFDRFNPQPKGDLARLFPGVDLTPAEDAPPLRGPA